MDKTINYINSKTNNEIYPKRASKLTMKMSRNKKKKKTKTTTPQN